MITKEQFAAAEREVAAIFQGNDDQLPLPDRTEFATGNTAATTRAPEADFAPTAQQSSSAEQRIARILQRVHAELNL